jgi:hypothetical protein
MKSPVLSKSPSTLYSKHQVANGKATLTLDNKCLPLKWKAFLGKTTLDITHFIDQSMVLFSFVSQQLQSSQLFLKVSQMFGGLISV